MARRIVDLPEPERPISTQISPRSTAKLMSMAPGTACVSAMIRSREAP
jgi:hypothetical protein